MVTTQASGKVLLHDRFRNWIAYAERVTCHNLGLLEISHLAQKTFGYDARQRPGISGYYHKGIL